MKFIELRILNLASLDRPSGEVINFEEGSLGQSTIFSIVGPTGSGKSTILDSICLALYNRAPRYPRKKGDRNQKIEIYGDPDEGEKNRLSPTDPRNILTRGRKEGYSKLTFEANNGSVYRAEWYVSKKIKNYTEAETSLYRLSTVNGKPVEETADWDTLPMIIGLDYEQFLRTVLIAQGAFSSFIKAKEEERAELLENLIGCKEQYVAISDAIKEKKDEAVRAYDVITAKFSAQEKDLIPEEELAAVLEKIAELEAIEKRNKDELVKVTEAIGWYLADEKHLAAIENFERAFNLAGQHLLDNREIFGRLNLHDETIEAVAIYKDIVTLGGTVEKTEKGLKEIAAAIESKQGLIEKETEQLEKLRAEAAKVLAEVERQKPHINRAREIKAQLAGLMREAKEKTEACKDADTALKKAKSEVDANAKAIDKASTDLKSFVRELSEIEKEIREKSLQLKNETEEATRRFNEVSVKLQGVDVEKLQKAKSTADKALAQLKDAIRIQEELAKQGLRRKEKSERQEQLKRRNEAIVAKLKTFEIEKLEGELETLEKTYTLMASEKWEQHRAQLKEGEACPLCGATHHPYHDTNVAALVLDGMKSVILEKRDTLNKQRDEKEKLSGEKAQNDGYLDAIAGELENIALNIAQLKSEWTAVQANHGDWPEDTIRLEALKPDIINAAEEAEKNLSEFNALNKTVERLRKEKEEAEKAQLDYDRLALEKFQAGEKRVNSADTLLSNEKAKTGNLVAQQADKEAALKMALQLVDKINAEISEKREALGKEIGDKDPDEFEKQLADSRIKADKAVNEQAEAVSELRQQVGKERGKEQEMKRSREETLTTLSRRKIELEGRIEAYNRGKTEKIGQDVIIGLYSSADNWEDIRRKQKMLTEQYTSAQTTLNNEKTAHAAHQKNRPEKAKEELLRRKTELEEQSNTELVEHKTRLKQHEEAKLQMGEMFEHKTRAETNKREWEEINAAIGADGKTLRKIAQCYTLRFLIEHANDEIRKFNSRYELMQVKNSLGIRVIDHDRADDVRDTTSLSGGETFIVSLGLALGLSSLSSRNISLGNLFIDEGFGTLDPDTLNSVIESLAMLQSSQGKKVGVISHTDTMREQITTQIRVIKNGNSGSSHIEIYP